MNTSHKLMRSWRPIWLSEHASPFHSLWWGWVPDFILKDPCREVQLEVSNSCISSLFECFDSTAVAWRQDAFKTGLHEKWLGKKRIIKKYIWAYTIEHCIFWCFVFQDPALIVGIPRCFIFIHIFAAPCFRSLMNFDQCWTSPVSS